MNPPYVKVFFDYSAKKYITKKYTMNFSNDMSYILYASCFIYTNEPCFYIYSKWMTNVITYNSMKHSHDFCCHIYDTDMIQKYRKNMTSNIMYNTTYIIDEI